MKVKSFKKIFLILFLTGFLFFLLSDFILAAEVEIEYPEIPGAVTPRTTKTFLPEYIRYLFNFAIVLAGLVAFVSLVYGGTRYLVSAGSPVAISDAKSQITAGILGLLLILGSYLLLTTINPQLTILKVGELTVAKGVILFTASPAGPSFGSCEGTPDPGGAGLEEGTDFLRVRRDTSSLRDLMGENYDERSLASFYFINSGMELMVIFYTEEDYQGTAFKIDVQEANQCWTFQMLNAIGIPLAAIKSIDLRWKVPGVYLYAGTDCETTPQFHEHLAYTGDTADFGNFHDKAKSLKILPWVKKSWKCDLTKCPGISPDACLARPDCRSELLTVTEKFGAILHEQSDFHGDVEVFFGGDFHDLPPPCINLSEAGGPCPNVWPGPYCQERVNHNEPRSSAITIFKQRRPGEASVGDGVTLYANYDYNDLDDPKDNNRYCGPFKPQQPLWVTKDSNGEGTDCVGGEGKEVRCEDCNYVLGGAGDPQGSSIEVDGNFIAVLFWGDGRGEVFEQGDKRLKDNHIGDDEARYMLVIPIAQTRD